MLKIGKKIAILILFLSLGGCDSVIDFVSTDYGDRQPFDPPNIYSLWYDEVESCVGRNGYYGSIDWFTSSTIRFNQEPVNAIWFPGNEIILHTRVAQAGVAAEHIVKHEMIHDVMYEGFELHDRRPDLFEDCAR